MDLTSGIVWVVLIGVMALLVFAASRFSLRWLRWFACVTVFLLAAGVTRFGLMHPEPGSVSILDSFLSGVDRGIVALVHPFWPGRVPAPGVAGRWVLAVALFLGYRLLEGRALARQAPEIDLSAIGRDRPSGRSHSHSAGRPSRRNDGRRAVAERQAELAAELRFRLPAMEVRTPSILPGGARTNALASIAETSGISGAGILGAVVRFAGMIWPGPRLVRVRGWVESAPGTRITVLLENVKTGLPIATKTVAGQDFSEAVSMVAGYIAREIFPMDPTVPGWCYGMANGRDLGAMQLARLERFYAACDRAVCESRKAQIRILSSETGPIRTAGVVRYELAQLLVLDDQNLESLRLHALNRELHPRFYRGRYRFAMSLEMISHQDHYLPDNEAMLRKLAEILDSINRHGHADRTLQSHAEAMREVADKKAGISGSAGVARCSLVPPDLALKLLEIAKKDLRKVRSHLSLVHVMWDAFFRRDERMVWLPHRNYRHRRSFQDGVYAAELLVAARCRLREPGGKAVHWFKHARGCWHLRRAIRITWRITGYPALIVAVLKNPDRSWRDTEAANPKLDRLSRALVGWPPWRRKSTSWPAAYNTACLYAALADTARRDRAPDEVLQELERRVIVSLRTVIDNPRSELERAWDWISGDPDFRIMRDNPATFTVFGRFLAELKQQEYPDSDSGRCQVPHAHPAAIFDAAARRPAPPESPIFSPVPSPTPIGDGEHAWILPVPAQLRAAEPASSTALACATTSHRRQSQLAVAPYDVVRSPVCHHRAEHHDGERVRRAGPHSLSQLRVRPNLFS
jgi:hypothetical protein